MNLQVKKNELVNELLMVEYKLSKLGIMNVLQKRKLKARADEINNSLMLIEEVAELAASKIEADIR